MSKSVLIASSNFTVKVLKSTSYANMHPCDPAEELFSFPAWAKRATKEAMTKQEERIATLLAAVAEFAAKDTQSKAKELRKLFDDLEYTGTLQQDCFSLYQVERCAIRLFNSMGADNIGKALREYDGLEAFESVLKGKAEAKAKAEAKRSAAKAKKEAAPAKAAPKAKATATKAKAAPAKEEKPAAKAAPKKAPAPKAKTETTKTVKTKATEAPAKRSIEEANGILTTVTELLLQEYSTKNVGAVVTGLIEFLTNKLTDGQVQALAACITSALQAEADAESARVEEEKAAAAAKAEAKKAAKKAADAKRAAAKKAAK